MMSGDTEQGNEFCWGALAARVLHPVDVQIIEALGWIEQPLSAGDLALLFEGKPPSALVGRHIERLARLDAIERSEVPTARRIREIRYRLMRKPRDGGE